MHNAPAVSYPVGRSAFHGIALGAISLSGLLAGLMWRYQAEPPVWRQALFAAILLATSLAALEAWRHSPCGSLQWDGRVWNLNVPGAALCGRLTVHLDLQWCLLLCLNAGHGGRQWLWLERRGAVSAWHALRRAVFLPGAADRTPDADADDHRSQVKS